jgi:hypothetical protein
LLQKNLPMKTVVLNPTPHPKNDAAKCRRTETILECTLLFYILKFAFVFFFQNFLC